MGSRRGTGLGAGQRSPSRHAAGSQQHPKGLFRQRRDCAAGAASACPLPRAHTSSGPPSWSISASSGLLGSSSCAREGRQVCIGRACRLGRPCGSLLRRSHTQQHEASQTASTGNPRPHLLHHLQQRLSALQRLAVCLLRRRVARLPLRLPRLLLAPALQVQGASAGRAVSGDVINSHAFQFKEPSSTWQRTNAPPRAAAC